MSIRVTDSYLSSILVGDLNRSLGRLLDQQRMAGSMRRVNSYADDPRAVSTIQKYNSLISYNEQYMGNVTRSRIIVDSTDVALQNISEVLADVRVIALRESSAIATQQSMDTSRIEVENLMNRILDVLNTSVEGNYIFSGQQTKTPPFEVSNGTVVYQGDENDIQSRTGPNSTMTINVPGQVFLGSQSSALGGSTDLSPRVLGTTLLEDINMGDGWSSGAISVNDGAGNSWQVDLSTALTIDDVLTQINTATGGAVTASINPDGSGLVLDGVGPMTVGEVNGGTTARMLGINATTQSSSLQGRDIRAEATATTLLSDIESLSGSLPLGTMDVTWQGTTYSVDLSGATTLGDMVTTFNAAVPGMEMRLEESSIMLLGGAPESFQVENGDATNTASLLGVAGLGSPVRLFGMLEDLQTALTAGDKTAIRDAISELSSVEDTIYSLMTMNGGRQKDLDWADDILQQRDERLRSNLSLINDVDVAAVASELSRAETTYQASLLVTSRLYQSNLMQYLR